MHISRQKLKSGPPAVKGAVATLEAFHGGDLRAGENQSQRPVFELSVPDGDEMRNNVISGSHQILEFIQDDYDRAVFRQINE